MGAGAAAQQLAATLYLPGLTPVDAAPLLAGLAVTWLLVGAGLAAAAAPWAASAAPRRGWTALRVPPLR